MDASQSIYPPLLTENTFGRYRILHEPARARTQLIPGAVHFTTTASLPFWPGDYLWQSFYIRIPDLSLSLSLCLSNRPRCHGQKKRLCEQFYPEGQLDWLWMGGPK